jgi:hypothetical protein
MSSMDAHIEQTSFFCLLFIFRITLRARVTMPRIFRTLPDATKRSVSARPVAPLLSDLRVA